MLNERKTDFLSELKVRMSLRKPQWESLTIFAEALELLEWRKVISTQELNEQLHRLRSMFSTVTSFERNFVSISFSLATGIGKTRLMAGVMCYLHVVKGVKNFFVVAPNKTIYHKLKMDFSAEFEDKYVFSGLGEYIPVAPHIIDGDNFNTVYNHADMLIHIFNISKFTHGRSRNTEIARVNRLNESLGESYFNYLVGLDDLCIMMDESHHYHGEQGFAVINELNPVIGVEFTATPRIPTANGHTLFKNVVYEYSLAHALADGKYVKEPVVCTRENFDPSQYNQEDLDKIKLNDGIQLHKLTKALLTEYSLNNQKSPIKPFVLVVAMNVIHSNKIKDYLTSQSFENGYYEDKVLEVNSRQGKVESDENMQLLLNLEKEDSKIEIVIHVDKLKEGWDVKNLYTIIPLRASVSETLTEQTIGRGLRLPFGQRTGVDELDRLSIVCHERYSDIVNKANEPDSIVRRLYFIEPSIADNPNASDWETVAVSPTINEVLSEENILQELINEIEEQSDATEQAVLRVISRNMPRYIQTVQDDHYQRTDESVQNQKKVIVNQLRHDVKNIIGNDERNQRIFEQHCYRAYESITNALDSHSILIPEIIWTTTENQVYRFKDFTLNTENLTFYPLDDRMLGQELSIGGRQIELFDSEIDFYLNSERPVREIITEFVKREEDIYYEKCASLINSLINDAKNYFLSYLSADDTENVMRQQSRTIADTIYRQMKEHFIDTDTTSSIETIRYANIRRTRHVNHARILNFMTSVPSNEIRSTLFEGFLKSTYPQCKFDSTPELLFARILERDNEVVKWLKPFLGDIPIFYGMHRDRYNPDFIVVTNEKNYIIEVKAENMLSDEIVLKKARAVNDYCEIVNKYAIRDNRNQWEYVLLNHSLIDANSSFGFLVSRRSRV